MAKPYEGVPPSVRAEIVLGHLAPYAEAGNRKRVTVRDPLSGHFLRGPGLLGPPGRGGGVFWDLYGDDWRWVWRARWAIRQWRKQELADQALARTTTGEI